MKRDYIEFQDRSAPLAYLITFRTYGTWLHGDERGSMDRREYNVFGGAKIDPNPVYESRDRKLMKAPPFEMDTGARAAVGDAIDNVCSFRSYVLFAANVRTNHVHIVVSASGKPEFMMNSFKSYATRELRSPRLITDQTKVWSRHGSTRYLWIDRHIEIAVEYVVNGQGGELPEFDRVERP